MNRKKEIDKLCDLNLKEMDKLCDSNLKEIEIRTGRKLTVLEINIFTCGWWFGNNHREDINKIISRERTD